MTFLMIVKIILLIAAMFMGLSSIGANESETGDRCVVLTAVFTIALVMLQVFCK